MLGFTIHNGARQGSSRARFLSMKEAVLGKGYDLSLIFINPAEIRRLNLIYRGINSATDILSFPLSKNQGEIYICEAESRKEAKKFAREYDNFIDFLFIHGCVHLKGYDHGSTMEDIEIKLRRKFGV